LNFKEYASKFDAVIFDFDGVIVDTEKISLTIAEKILKNKFKISLTEEEKKSYFGLHDETYYKTILKKNKIISNINHMMKKHNDQYDPMIFKIKETPLQISPTSHLLQNLQRQGIYLDEFLYC